MEINSYSKTVPHYFKLSGWVVSSFYTKNNGYW